MNATESLLMVLDNDRQAFDECLNMASMAVGHRDTCSQVREKIWTPEQAERFLLADMAQEYVETLIDDPGVLNLKDVGEAGESVVKAFVRHAFEQVEWHEVADHYLLKYSEMISA
jgi:hypothetical protein